MTSPYDNSIKDVLWAPDSHGSTTSRKRRTVPVDNRVEARGLKLVPQTRSGLFVIAPLGKDHESRDNALRALTVGDFVLECYGDTRTLAPVEVVEVRPCESPDVPTIRGRSVWDGTILTYNADSLYRCEIVEGITSQEAAA